MEDFSKNISELAKKVHGAVINDLPIIVEVEGLNHFEESFDNEGFTDKSLEKWKPRKVKDKNGKDKRTYRTNRVGRVGDLTKFGRKNEDRAILTGHDSGNNKLRNSLRSESNSKEVVFATDKEYAEVHNEGGDHIPQRKFMGESEALNDKIIEEFEDVLDKIFE